MYIKVTLKKFLALWCAFALTYVIWFVILLFVTPEKWFFGLMTERYGFIDITQWDDWFVTFCLVGGLLCNIVTILLVMRSEVEKTT